jgi:hypothetical protein
MHSRSDIAPPGGRRRKEREVSLLDIDVALHDMVFQRYSSALNFLGHQRPSTIEDYAMEGFVAGADESFLVYISGYEGDSIDQFETEHDPDKRSPCYISTDRHVEYSWCTNVFVQGSIFRRLVEMYSSKRIDTVRLTVKLHVLRGPSDRVELPSVTFPMLGPSGALSTQHVRCQLLSVHTSLRADPAHEAEILPPPQNWGSRLGRRFG